MPKLQEMGKLDVRFNTCRIFPDHLAKADMEIDLRDVMNIAAIMAHAGTRNGNGDGFKDGDFDWAMETYGIFHSYRPGVLDDGHDRIARGTWTSSFLTTHEDVRAIQVEGAIWAWSNQEFARRVANLYQEGNLWFSMMCAFEWAECSACGREFGSLEPEDAYCDCMRNRRTNGNVRWIRHPWFLANSRVDVPADQDADGLAFASQGGNGNGLIVPADHADYQALTDAEKLSMYYQLRGVLL